jgi:hypothetical protein
MTNKWTQADAISLCIEIENICPPFGCHVALTGGNLYKTGPRKDCDILFYRIRQVEVIDVDGLLDALTKIGLGHSGDFGWVKKATYRGKSVDMFFPEFDDGEYGRQDPEEVAV